MTQCLFCSGKFPGYGRLGVCEPCKRTHPAFIPKAFLSRTEAKLPQGYVFRKDGAVRYDLSDTASQKGDAPQRLFRPLYDPFAGARAKPRKRTRQERLDSLHSRLASSFASGQLPDSMLQEVKREQIASGVEPMTDDQLRSLAAFYLNRTARTA